MDQTIGGVYQAYEARLRDLNLVDFDDLLLLVVRLWRERPEVLKDYRDRYEYLLVDEFQDTNHAQAELLRLLAGERRNLCVVGDDDQAIYGWRGADVSNILDFPRTYPGTTIIKLEENYRSSGGILEAANAAIAQNTRRHGKELWTRQGGGQLPYLVVTDDNDAEARAVAQLLKHYAGEARIAYRDMAVLYRSNHLSRPFEIELRAQHIPYRVVGSKAFYERREIKDAAAYLRIVSNPCNELSLRRILNVPPRGLGTGTVEKLQDYAGQHRLTLLVALQDEAFLASQTAKVAVACRAFTRAYVAARKAFDQAGDLAGNIRRYLEDIGYLGGLKRVYRNHEEAEDRLGNIIEFVNAAASYEQQQSGPASLLDFLEANALADENDRVEEEEAEDHQGVNLMTVHAAKGLEFRVVVVVALEQDVFPHERSLRERDVSEERRLFYVAVTRAKEHLALSRAKQRMRFGQRRPSPPSQFLLELPGKLVNQGPPADLFRPASENQVRAHLAQLQARLRAD